MVSKRHEQTMSDWYRLMNLWIKLILNDESLNSEMHSSEKVTPGWKHNWLKYHTEESGPLFCIETSNLSFLGLRMWARYFYSTGSYCNSKRKCYLKVSYDLFSSCLIQDATFWNAVVGVLRGGRQGRTMNRNSDK